MVARFWECSSPGQPGPDLRSAYPVVGQWLVRLLQARGFGELSPDFRGHQYKGGGGGYTSRCGGCDRDVKADENGIFHIPNILPGQSYRVVDWESHRESEKVKVDETLILAPR